VATLLSNGEFLIAGGSNTTSYFASAELYNPSTGSFTFTGSMNTARAVFTGTLLTNGEALVAGGENSQIIRISSAELYNPSTGRWTNTGSLHLVERVG
jgi:hypothetical protein